MSAYAQTQQQVAFIGDDPTYLWGQQAQFNSHTNWIADGSNAAEGPGESGVADAAVLKQLQTIIASGKKPIIHLLLGEGDSEAVQPSNTHSAQLAFWAENLENIITTAQQAKLAIIVGTTPYSYLGDVKDMNKWVLTYCAEHNIPVVNYAFALDSGTGFAASGHAAGDSGGSVPANVQAPVYYQNVTEPRGYTTYTITAQGWALMSDMAQTAIIQVEGYKLQGGYLDTVSWSQNEYEASLASANQITDGGIVQFTPYGQYTDGSTHVMNNADINGHIGTFSSSDPTALLVDQNGVGSALDSGTSNVHFTTLSGRTINEWVMYISIDCEYCPTSF